MCVPILLTGCNRKIDPNHTLIKVMLFEEADVAEDPEHALVLRQNVGHEAVQSTVATGLGQLFEKHGAEAMPLIGVGHNKRNLG